MRKRILIPAVICLLLSVLCILWYFRLHTSFAPAGDSPEHESASSPAVEPPRTPAAEPGTQKTEPAAPDPDDTVSDEAEPYVSPVDFDTLQAGNPDIYAWLLVEDSEISFPVVQNEDDTFYLDHDADGEPSNLGAIFTESAYNSKTFDDPITAIYGHRMYSGEMFGALQLLYSSRQALTDYGGITVYLPDRELHYQVFAAVPYDNRHIPYNYNDGTARGVKSFLRSISSLRSIDAYVDEETFAVSDDKLLVLSTCLYGDRNRRFLVVAKQT